MVSYCDNVLFSTSPFSILQIIFFILIVIMLSFKSSKCYKLSLTSCYFQYFKNIIMLNNGCTTIQIRTIKTPTV